MVRKMKQIISLQHNDYKNSTSLVGCNRLAIFAMGTEPREGKL
jgi:hypothetical protein